MKKIFIYSFILTCIFIFCPLFNTNFNKENVCGSDKSREAACNNMKMPYYTKLDNTKIYDDSSNVHNVKYVLGKNEEVIGYYKKNGYVYCEENKNGRFGWIRENDLKDVIYKDTEYILDIDLNSSNINVIKKNQVIKTIPYFLNDEQHSYSQVPVGTFYINSRGSYNYEGQKRYYLKFFSNYLIHSIPLDEKGNIIEYGKDKFEFNIAYGSIRVSTQDSGWIFKFVPDGSAVIIHY